METLIRGIRIMLIGDKLDEMNLLKRLDENILKYYGAYIRGSKSFHY